MGGEGTNAGTKMRDEGAQEDDAAMLAGMTKIQQLKYKKKKRQEEEERKKAMLG